MSRASSMLPWIRRPELRLVRNSCLALGLLAVSFTVLFAALFGVLPAPVALADEAGSDGTGSDGTGSDGTGTPVRLYELRSPKILTSAPDDPAVIRSGPITIDFDALDRLAKGMTATDENQPILEIPLLDGTALRFELAGVEQNFVGHVAHAVGPDGANLTLAWGDGVLMGTVERPIDGPGVGTPADGWRLRWTTDGHVLEALDLSASTLSDLAEVDDVIPIPPSDTVPSADPASSGTGGGSPTKDSGAIIDVLAVYTPAARNGVGGTAAIRQLISLGINQTNRANGDSSVFPRVRLVGLQEIAYNEGGRSNSQHLGLLRGQNDGVMDSVHALRDAVGADLVAMVGNTTAGSCGVAYLLSGSNNPGFASSAFSYTARQCMGNTRYTFSHELGHNMGCNHAPVDPVGTGAYNFSFGYKDPDRRFRTVMAYSCDGGCPRVLRWSNPRQSIGSSPLGTTSQDNSRSLNSIRVVVANFRQEADGEPGTLELVDPEVSITEDRPEVVITVRRSDGTDGQVSLPWSTTSITAIDGEDFGDGNTSGTLAWSSGEGGDQQIRIPLIDDGSLEGDESFTVTLGNPTGGAELGPVTAVAVTLVDNDVEPFECVENDEVHCLRNGRFEVRIAWRTGDSNGDASGEARAVRPRADDSGLFWFFQPDNWEMLVKVLDGCSINDHHWLLFAATTDIGYTVRVTDTERGLFRTWDRPPGEATPAITDITAFATCP